MDRKHRRTYLKKWRQNHRKEYLISKMKYRQAHKKQIVAYRREYNQRPEIKKQHIEKNKRIRWSVINYYSNKTMQCSCCGEKHLEFLTIDHLNGGGNEHRKTIGRGNQFYHWLVKNNFPEGYRVLCYNCNSSLGHYGYCPHKKMEGLRITEEK